MKWVDRLKWTDQSGQMIVSQFGRGFRVAVVFLNHFVGLDEMAFAFISRTEITSDYRLILPDNRVI